MNKVYQENGHDCTWASMATILGWDYSIFPRESFDSYDHIDNNGNLIRKAILITSHNSWLEQHNIKLTAVPYDEIHSNSRLLRIGAVFPEGNWVGHAVVLKGRKIVHDPARWVIPWVNESNIEFALEVEHA